MSNDARKSLALSTLSNTRTASDLAEREGVSRKFLYQQKRIAEEAIDEAFAGKDNDVLFYLPVTRAWLDQLMIALILICHSSYGGVKELLRDLFNTSVSIGTIHNRVQEAAGQAAVINREQNLSAIRVGLLDEIFQGTMPVLASIDAASTFCHILEGVEHRDAETWAIYLRDAKAQGFNPAYTIADAGTGLRAGHKLALGDTPCHGDVFHIQQQCETLSNVLTRVAKGTVTRRKALEIKMDAAGDTNSERSAQMAIALQSEQQAVQLARDVKTLMQWLGHDILALAGPDLAQRRILFDWVVAELLQREQLDSHRIRPVRVALENQRDDVLAFAGVLDEKFAVIAQSCKVSIDLVRDACLLQRKSPLSTSYWQRWNQLHNKLAGKFQRVVNAVISAMKSTPRASSLVENLNSRLRNYFFLRKQLHTPYLGLLQFFLNHRTFLRSNLPERVGKSPKQLMTGQSHPHWLELLGFTLFKRA